MSRIVTRELAQEEAEALVAAQKKSAPAAAPVAAPVNAAPAKSLPATPQPDITQPVTSGPGGDARDSGQPSVHETLTSVAETMKTNG